MGYRWPGASYRELLVDVTAQSSLIHSQHPIFHPPNFADALCLLFFPHSKQTLLPSPCSLEQFISLLHHLNLVLPEDPYPCIFVRQMLLFLTGAPSAIGATEALSSEAPISWFPSVPSELPFLYSSPPKFLLPDAHTFPPCDYCRLSGHFC